MLWRVQPTFLREWQHRFGDTTTNTWAVCCVVTLRQLWCHWVGFFSFILIMWDHGCMSCSSLAAMLFITGNNCPKPPDHLRSQGRDGEEKEAQRYWITVPRLPSPAIVPWMSHQSTALHQGSRKRDLLWKTSRRGEGLLSVDLTTVSGKPRQPGESNIDPRLTQQLEVESPNDL